MRIGIWAPLSAFLLCPLSVPAFAQEGPINFQAANQNLTPASPAGNGSDWHYSLGAGVMAAPTYEGSEHYRLRAMPTASVSWRNGISLSTNDGLKAVMRPLIDKHFTVTAGLGYWLGRQQGADKDHGDALRGLGDVSGNAIGRLGVGYEFGVGDVGLDFNRDLGGDRDGATITLHGGYLLYRAQAFHVKAELSTTWADDEYMSTMFGITPSQAAASTRHYSAYSASAGIKDVSFGLKANYDLTQSVGLFAMAGIKRLTGDAADSPIVKSAGDANQYSAGLGLLYHF